MSTVLTWARNHKALIAAVGAAITLSANGSYVEAFAAIMAALSAGNKGLSAAR